MNTSEIKSQPENENINETDENIISQNDNTDKLIYSNESDQKALDVASEASKASYILEPEKGISPDPAMLNSRKENEENNIKK